MKKIVFKCLLALIGIQVIVLCILVGNVISSIYSNKIEIVDKNEALNVGVENIETPEIEKDEVILPVEDDKIDESLVKDDVIYKETQKKEEVINIVLTGMDARAYETKSRSDSIILVSYNTADHTVKMVSFLRDTWVYLPERGWGRINSATAYGGTGLLINTLNENFDLDIQNYVQIKFDDFKKVIDILGGVDVELTQSEINYINNKLHTDDNDWKNDVKAKPGIVHLNGTQTLWHCRNRTIGDGDFARTDRQREVLTLLIDKAMSMPITKVTSLIYEVKDYVNTNVPISTIIGIAEDALISRNIKIESYSIPFDGMFNYANKNGASVIEVNLYDTAVKLHEVLGLDTDDVEVIKVKDTKNYSKPKPQPKPEIPPVVETKPEVPETPETPESSEIDENIDVVIPEIENNTEDGNVDNPENNEGSQDYEKIDGEGNSDVVSSENEDGNVDDTEENVIPIISEEENFDNSDVNTDNNLDNDSTNSVEETI